MGIRSSFDSEEKWLNFSLSDYGPVDMQREAAEDLVLTALDDVTTVDVRELSRFFVAEDSLMPRSADILQTLYVDHPEKAREHVALFESDDPTEQWMAIESFRTSVFGKRLDDETVREALQTAVEQLPDVTIGGWPVEQSTSAAKRDVEIANLLESYSDDDPESVSEAIAPLLPPSGASRQEYDVNLLLDGVMTALRNLAEADVVPDREAMVNAFEAVLAVWEDLELDHPREMGGRRAACYGLAALESTRSLDLLGEVAANASSQTVRSAAQKAVEQLEAAAE